MVELSGAAKYFSDFKSSEKQTRVTLKYTSTTHRERLNMEKLGTPKALDSQSALEVTHYVSEIIYGSDAFFVFDRKVNEAENIKAIQSMMETEIKHLLSNSGDSLQIKQEEKERIQCKYYGDKLLSANPSTFDEGIKVYKELSNAQSVPKIVLLCPLPEMGKKIVSSIINSKVEEIMESFHRAEVRAKDLQKNDICSQFTDLHDQLQKFLDLIKNNKTVFLNELSKLLLKIRRSEAGENDLKKLITSHNQSPFSSKEMDKYIQDKKKEIHQLSLLLKNLKKQPSIKFVFENEAAESDTDIMTLTCEFEQVLCFAFNITSDTCNYIKCLESYPNEVKLKSSAAKEWFSNPEVLKRKIVSFIEFVEENSSNSKLAFAVTNYCENTSTSGPALILYDENGERNFETPGKPGTPEALLAGKGPGHSSVTIKWSKPECGADSVTKFIVSYYQEEILMSCSTAETKIEIDNLLPGVTYEFYVQAESALGLSAKSDTCSITTRENIRPADLILSKTKLLKKGSPSVYELPMHLIHGNKSDGLFKYDVGPPSKSRTYTKPERVLMVLGATGAGKSTLINGIANYVYGVKWEDDFRFKIITNEGPQSQAHSQTKTITAYSFHDTILKYTLTVVDTPGFGDTGGIERDKAIARQIKKFFSGEDRAGVDQIDGIGFVTQASLARLTPTQKYIFDAVLSIFGKDISDNISLMATFADANRPPVLEAAKAAKIPYKESFRFNNSALFSPNSDEFNAMFWKMGCTSFDNFFKHFSIAEARSLALTREVLKERKQLETLIPGLQEQVQIGLSQLDTIRQEELVLKQHEAEIIANKNFEYDIEVTKFRKVPLHGVHTTTCMTCNFTCHDKCIFSNDSDKARCSAMKDGNCTICPQKCPWNRHSNIPFRFDYYTTTERRTYDNLKQSYETAKTGKEKIAEMIQENEGRLQMLQTQVYTLIDQV